jgi:hypothetical protein
MEQDRLPALTEVVVELASLSAQILAHMARWQGRSAPDAPPPEPVFRDLLTETLRPVLDGHPPAASRAAQRILAEAVETIEAEILLVEPSGRPRGQRLRSRTPRRLL